MHALSYPLGGTYHVPHGEANYQFFTEIFKLYQLKAPHGKIEELNRILSESLQSNGWGGVYEQLDELLSHLLKKKPLREYGMKEADIDGFTQNVIKTQQRLLANNYVALSEDEIRDIYRKLY